VGSTPAHAATRAGPGGPAASVSAAGMCGGYSRIAAMKRVLLVDDEPELTQVVRE